MADHARIPEERRRNYEILARGLAGMKAVEPLFPVLPPGVCPLFMGVRVADPRSMQRLLARQGVGTKYFWSYFHDAVPIERFAFETALKRGVVVLPVHQALGEADMRRIAMRVEDWARTQPPPPVVARGSS